MTNQNSAAQAANDNPLSDEYVNAIIQRHGYDSPETVIARLAQWIGLHSGENGVTLLMYEAHKALSKLRAPVADERAAFKKCHSAIIKALASIAMADGPDTRKEDDPELLYRSPVMDDVVRIRVALDECSAALASAPVAGEAVALELRGVPETIKEGDGFWRACTGCHELNEGRDTGPYSAVLGCHLGQGCSECGGIGAIWDSTDYQAMADDMARSMGQSVSAAPQASALNAEYTRGRADGFDAGHSAALEKVAAALEDHRKAGREWVPGSLWDNLSREAAARIRALKPSQASNGRGGLMTDAVVLPPLPAELRDTETHSRQYAHDAVLLDRLTRARAGENHV